MIFSFPFSSQSDPVVWSQLRFPQGFLKGKQTALNCSCAFFNCWLSDWSCQTICSISHGKQYKLIYGLPGWHNSPERLKAFLNLSTLWESLWASEAKDNCAHLSQSCWSERKESTIHLYCCLPISPPHQHIILPASRRRRAPLDTAESRPLSSSQTNWDLLGFLFYGLRAGIMFWNVNDNK